MNRVLFVRLIALIFLFPLASTASANCDPASDLDGFSDWIEAIKNEPCLSQELARYPELGAEPSASTLVAATNGYHAVIRQFFDILETDEFDSPIQDKIFDIDGNKEALGIGKPVSEFSHLLISLQEPNPRADDRFSGAIRIGSVSVGNYAEYLTLCVDEIDQDKCDAWIKTVKLMAAVDSLVVKYQQVINDEVLNNFDKELTRYINLWDDYYEQRKPQMPWEMAINQVANRDLRTAKYFATPPAGDWVVMHPSLVYSSISAADDGDEKDFALAIELIGYNWWKNDKLSGFSLVGVTSDREGIEDEGYGLMLHFGSRYSLGWSRHDDEDGWFVSIDLLGAAVNKKKELQQWEADFRESVEAFKQ